MIVQPGQSVNLPGQSATWAFIDVQSVGERTGFKVGENFYSVEAYPEAMTVDLPYSGVAVVFLNQGPAALGICLHPPNVPPWGTQS